jgi:hypothetical protein
MRKFVKMDGSSIVIFTDDKDKEIVKYENNEEWYEWFDLEMMQ